MLSYRVLNQALRQEQKKKAREADAEALRKGLVSNSELARTNGFFSSLDLRSAEIVGIGSKEIANLRDRSA